MTNPVFEETTTFEPSAFKLIATMGLGGTGAAVGLLCVMHALFGAGFNSTIGGSIFAFLLTLVAAALGVAIVRKRPRLEIDSAGFTILPLFGETARRWSDIDGDFEVIKVGWTQGVGYRLTTAYKEANRFTPTTLFAGNDEALSGAFAAPMQQIADALNERKRRAACSSAGSAASAP
ncbi:MAG TPA: hypothetical protein VGE52_05020 [Pirellulales bacterium]